MLPITRKHLADPEETMPFKHGKSTLVRFGDEEVWRSVLEPGWNWDEDLEPYAEGATSCPLTHRELVVLRGEVVPDDAGGRSPAE